MLSYVLQSLIVLFSLMAGGFWTKSAMVKLPNMMENTTWAGTGAFPDALQSQAKWNRFAAVSAAIAAAAQAALFLIGHPAV